MPRCFQLRVSILSLKDPRTIYQIQSPKFAASHSYSFSDTYFALLERHEHRDCIAIYSPSDSWCLLRVRLSSPQLRHVCRQRLITNESAEHRDTGPDQ